MKPLCLLGPRRNTLGEGNVKASVWDLDLTLLAIASFCGFLLNVSPVSIFGRPARLILHSPQGMAPNKYMYAEHLFEWDATQVTYTIFKSVSRY